MYLLQTEIYLGGPTTSLPSMEIYLRRPGMNLPRMEIYRPLSEIFPERPEMIPRAQPKSILRRP